MKFEILEPQKSHDVDSDEKSHLKKMHQPRYRVAGFAIAIVLGLVLLFIFLSFFSPRPLPIEAALLSLAKYDVNILHGYMNPSEAELRRALRLNVLMLGGFVLLLGGLYRVRARLLQPKVVQRIFSISVTIACSAAIFVALAQPAYELMAFNPVKTLMTTPASLPIFGHRLLLVWLADALKGIAPSLSYRRCYLATQCIAAFAATYMVGRWSSLFIGKKWKFIGQILLVVMTVPNFLYDTFYDIPIVFFYAACLTLLYKKLYSFFILLVGVATLNHENALLLVVVAAFTLYGVAPLRTWLMVPLGAFTLWLAVRISMQYFLPMDSHFEPHVWSNLLDHARPPGDLVKSAASLGLWWICGAMGFARAHQFVRRATILLPALVGVTFVAGHFNEARQFDAFIPVAIALILSYIRTQLLGSEPVTS